jgi:DNA-binding transcriptional LysR family regulator
MLPLADFTVQQIGILAQLGETKGIRDLARKNSMDPAAVSRLIQQAERILGFSLALRTKRGLLLTSEGQQVVERAAKLFAHLKSFDDFKSIDPVFARIPTFTLGSRGFLATLLAGILAKTPIEELKFKIRFVDSSPADLLRASLAGAVDLAVHLENWSWPNSWITREVANLTWGLVARADHPLGPVATLAQTQKYPFIAASYLANDRVERSADVFPLKWSERRVGHESQTAFTSKAILLASDHVSFLPLVTVEREILEKKIKVIKVKGIDLVQMNIRFSLNQDRVPKRAEAILGKVLSELNEIDARLARPLLAGVGPTVKRAPNKISL